MLSATKLGLTNPDATRIANEVSQWKLDTHYNPTPEDELVLKSVAMGTVRRTLYKIVGATAAAVGVSYLFSARSKSKVPMTVSIAVGFLAGSYIDAYTRQRELVGTWIQLQRKNTTPLAEKLYSTVYNVTPTTEAGQIAKTWMDDNAAILPILPPAPPKQFPIPSSGGLARRAGSGYYDVTSPQASPSSSSSLPLPIHRPGSGFYDSKNNSDNNISSSSSSSSSPYPVSSPISPTIQNVQDTAQEAKETLEEPVRRAPVLRHERHLRRPRILDPTQVQSTDSEQTLQNKIQSGGNRYGDE